MNIEDSISIGKLVGLVINVGLQYLVWRYLFVYYSLSGEKSEFYKNSNAFTVLIIAFSLIVYGFASSSNPFVGLAFLIGMFYFAFTLKKKWDSNDILPDPFSNE
ncbi:hypothetical protein HOA87_04425 [bacterium]|nr:hypothetical protein [bacterium]